MSGTLTHTTASEIRRLFAERGLRPKKSLGQNFLVDRNLLRILADAAEVASGDAVLEIGAGTGSLTEVLAARACCVIAVEIDEQLCEIARQSLASLPNVRLICANILSGRECLNPEVLEVIRGAGERPLRVVGDLPYSISTPLLTALLTASLEIKVMVVTVQAEVAERIIARPGTKAYGFLSVQAQLIATVELVRRLPPQVFWPRPQVWSSVVRLRPKPEREAVLKVLPGVRRVAAALFQQRRKDAANALAHAGLANSRQAAEKVLMAAGLRPDAKADAVSPEQVQRIASLLGLD